MREITEKIRKARSDRDLIAIANEYEVSVKDIFHLHNILTTHGNCKNNVRQKGF